jgi:photosystem II stability/assembly factor-like uncharacterized protein
MIGRCAVSAHKRPRAALRAIVAVLLLTAVGHAGHAPLVPEPRTILLRDDEPDHLVIGTRRGGYFVTRDAGATWSWMCEAGIGYDDEEVYPGALLPGGTLIVSTGFGGVAVSADGCGFTPWLPSEQPFVADVRADPGSPGAVIALDAHTAGDAFVNRLWRSSDGAKSWQPLGAPFAPDALASSFAISEQGELYVGVAGAEGAELLRSADAALSWQRSPLSMEPGVTPRVIGARGAPGRSRVFVIADYAQAEGITIAGDRALLSTDGGQTFATLLEATGDLSSWALSANGERLAVGGHDDGIYLLQDAGSASQGAVMTLVASRRVHALAWSAQGRLYAAGHEASDGFSVGVSDDDGRTFRGVFALCQVKAPLACPTDTSVGTECKSSGETGWDVRKEVAASDACTATGELSDAPPAGDPPVDVPGTDTHEPHEADGDAPPDEHSPASASRGDGSCAFMAAPFGSSTSLSVSFAMLVASLAARRAGSRLRTETKRP